MDNEILTLQVDINDNPLNEKVDSIEKKITTLKEKASTMLSTGDTSAVPGFLDDTASLWRTLQNNLDNISRTRKSIEHAANSYEQESLIHSYKRQIETANRSLTSLFQSTDLARGLSDTLGKELSAAFAQSIRSVAPNLAHGLKQSAQAFANSGSLQSDARIVERFMGSDDYRQIMSSLQKANPTLYSSQNMQRYLRSVLPTHVPQWLRGDIAGGLLTSGRSAPNSFREMLPAAFQKIPYQRDNNLRQLNAGSELLTTEERDRLFRMVRNERFAADSAVQAGIIRKQNGKMYYNPRTTRNMVNAMAGFAMQDAVIGARGERKYGITDLDDPWAWEHIQKKNNTYITGGLSTMRSMQDAFGSWLNPGYYSGLSPFTRSGVSVGRITHSPRIQSRAFAEYTLDAMNKGWQINGVNPIVNGKVLSNVTAPTGKITPDDWHTISLRSSMLQDILEGTDVSDRPGHNNFSRNAIYLALDKRLSSPYIKKEEEEELIRQYADRFEKGYEVGGVHHSFTRANKTHAEFVPDPLLQAIGRKQKGLGYYSDMSDLQAGLNFLRGGVGYGVYNAYEQFSKDQNVPNTMATEGESLLSYMGSRSPKVVVGNFSYTDANGQKHKLLDGQNIISSLLSPNGFQGRGYGDKATFSPMNFAEFRKVYSNLIYGNDDTAQRIREAEAQYGRSLTRAERDQIVQQYGDLVIPGAGINGGALVVPYDTDIIEDVANIKSYETGLKGKTQAELNAIRTRTYAENPLYAKTTYDDARTSSRWISNQLVASMNGGFNDPEVSRYFQGVFEDELLRLNDEQYVRQTLFGGDQDIDLNSREAQGVIMNYQNNLFNRWSRGDRLTPAGTFGYQMAAASFPTAVNRLLTQAGFQLSDDQQLLNVASNGVWSLDSLADMLGVVRFPATGAGNQTAVNLANDPVVGAKVRKLASQLGMDPKALYFNPESPMLEAMQGEDFDGDLNGIFELARSNNPAFANVMQKVFRLSQEKYAQIMDASNRTPEQQATVRKKQTYTTENGDHYDPNNMMDVARVVANGQKVAGHMGQASGYLMDAWQHPITETVARAVRDSGDMSDVMSVANKKGQEYKTTEEQWALMRGGHEFGRIFNWASKAAGIEGENDDSRAVWTGKSNEELFAHHLDEVNLPSVNVRSTLDTLATRYIQKRKGRNIDGDNGNDGRVFDWDNIFAALDIASPVDKNTWTGKMTSRLRDIKRDILNAEYLLPSDEAAAEIDQLQQYAWDEITKQVESEGLTGAKKDNEISKRFRQAGGYVAKNLASGGFAMSTSSALADQYIADTLGQIQGMYPGAQLFGPAAGFNFIQSDDALRAAENANRERQRQLEELRAKRRTTVTMGSTVPPTAAEEALAQKAEEMLESETPMQEARRLLEVAGIKGKKLDALTAMPETALSEAVRSGNWKALKVPNVIGDKVAKDAVAALTGSKLAQMSAGSEASGQIAEAIVEQEATAAKDIQTVTHEYLEERAEKIREGKKAIAEQTDHISAESTSEGLVALAGEAVTPTQEEQELERQIAETQQNIQAYKDQKAREPERAAALAEFNELISGAKEFSTGLWSHMRKTENKLQDVPYSLIEFEKNRGIARAYTANLQKFKESEGYNLLNANQQAQLDKLITGENSLEARAIRDFGESGVLRSRDLAENLGTAVSKLNGTYNPQIESLNEWEKKIADVTAAQQKLLEMSADDQYTDKQKENFKSWAEDIGKNIDSAIQQKDKLKELYTVQNEKSFDRQITGIEDKVFGGNRFQQMSKQYRESIQQIRTSIGQQHDQGLITDKAYDQDMSRLKELEKATSTAALSMRSSFNKIGDALSKSISRIGTQMFRKALQETKQFVQEFDKSMTQIQMITLKSDKQITELGNHLIQVALNTGTSVSDVTSAASNLYRQGLSDEEVDARLDDVLKFSTVAGIKTEEASKIITTALQNDLVGTSEEAMDALVALGDTAATTASEIAKGMQKSAASAKQAGMSYGELVTLLTIGTSRTQLGGASIGSALQTMLYRLYKVNKNEDYYDENGNHIASTDATKALARMGVSIFDDNGNFRGPYQILQDIAMGWESADDITQSAILSTLGAGRQRSNVATFFQGLAEDNGEIANRYLSTAESSQGITDEKYQAYLDSLQAKINGVKTSWDQLVNAFNISGFAGDALSGISSFIQGLTSAIEASNGLAASIPVLVAAIAALGVAVKAHPVIAALAGVAAITSVIGNENRRISKITEENSESYQYSQTAKRETNAINSLQADINRAKELYKIAEENGGEYSSLSKDQQEELSGILTRLGNEFGNTSNAARDLANNFSSVGEQIENYQKSLDEYSISATKRAVAGLPISDNINDLIDENAPAGAMITPEQILKFSANKSLALFGYNPKDTSQESLRSYWQGLSAPSDIVKPILETLFVQGRTGAKVGSVDDYFRLLKSDSDEGEAARNTFLSEVDKISSEGYAYIADDYIDYLKEIIHAYADSSLRDRLNANGIFDEAEIDSIVATFISNILQVLTGYDASNLASLNLSALVNEEIQKMISQIWEGDSLTSGVNAYTGQDVKIQEQAAEILANEENREKILNRLKNNYYDSDIIPVLKPVTETTYTDKEGKKYTYTGEEGAKEAEFQSWVDYASDHPVRAGSRYQTAEEVLADAQKAEKLRQQAQQEFLDEYGTVTEVEDYFYNGLGYRNYEFANELARNDYVKNNVRKIESVVEESRADRARRFMASHPGFSTGSVKLDTYDEVADWLESNGYNLGPAERRYTSEYEYNDAVAKTEEEYQALVEAAIRDFESGYGEHPLKKLRYETSKNHHALNVQDASDVAAAYNALIEEYVQSKLTDNDWVVSNGADLIHTSTYNGETLIGEGSTSELEAKQEEDWKKQKNIRTSQYYATEDGTIALRDITSDLEANAWQLNEALKKAEETISSAASDADAALEIIRIAEDLDLLGGKEPEQIDKFFKTVTGAQSSYYSNNANAYAAERLYNEITAEGITSLGGLIEKVNTDQFPDFSTVMNAFPELSEVILSFAEQTEDGSWKLKDGIDDTGNAFAQLRAAIANLTLHFSGAEDLTRSGITSAAREFLTNPTATSQYKDEFQTIIGKNLTNKTIGGQLETFEEQYINDLIDNYAVGLQGLTGAQQLSGARTLLGMINNGQYGEIQKMDEDMLSAYTSNINGFDEYYRIAQQVDFKGGDWSDYADQLEEAGKTVQEMQNAQKNLNKAVYDGGVDLHKTGDYAEEYASSLKNLNKGGITATKALASLKDSALTSQDMITATQKARGKSGKQLDSTTKSLIAGYLGLDDAKKLNDYTKEELDAALDSIEQGVNEEFAQANLQPVLQSAIDTLGANLEPVELKQAIDLVTDVNGDLNISELAAVVEQYNSSLAAALRAYEGILAEYHARVTATSDGEGNGDVYVVGDVSTNIKGKGKSGGYNHKSGGGGGGKSAAQKLVEEQKHRIAAYDHEVKMIQIQETHYEITGNYDAYLSKLDEEYDAQMDLASVYQTCITELKAQQATLKENSDDWHTVTEQLYAYEEALEQINDITSELNKKRIDALQTQHDNEDVYQSHESSILEIQADVNRTAEEYAALYETINKQRQNINDTIAQNLRQRDEWYARLADEEAGSQNYKDIEAKIFSIDEENAKLNADLASSILDEANTRIQEMSDITTRLQTPVNYSIALRQSLGTTEKDFGNFEGYREHLAGELVDQETLRQAQTDAKEYYHALMQIYERGTPEWYAARNAMLGAAESEVEVLNRMREINIEIEQSKIDELADSYRELSSAVSMYQSIIGSKKSVAETQEDFAGIRDAAEKERKGLLESVVRRGDAIDKAWVQLLTNENLTYEQRKQLQEQIRTEQTDLWTDLAGVTAAEKAKLQTYIDEIGYRSSVETVGENNRIKGVQQQTTIAQMNQNYAATRASLMEEQDALTRDVTSDRAILKSYQDLISNGVITPDSPLYKTLTEKIYEQEQAIGDKLLQIEQKRQEIQKNLLAETKESLSDSSGTYSHVMNLLNKSLQMSSFDNDFTGLNNLYTEQIERTGARYEELESELQSLTEQINTITDPAVLKELQDIERQKIEEMAGVAIDYRAAQNARQLNEARRVMDSFNDSTPYEEVQTQLINDMMSRLQQNGDDEGYLKLLDASMENISNIRARDAELLEEVKTAMAGMDPDGEAYKTLESAYLNLTKRISNADAQMETRKLERENKQINDALEIQSNAALLREHSMTLVQYEQSKYENAGELTNYGKMIEAENRLRRENVAELTSEMNTLIRLRDEETENADNKNRLTQEIMRHEEAIKAENNAIEANNKKLKENQNAINETRKTLEDSVREQLKKNQDYQDQLLSDTVSAQDAVLESIRKTYESEWELIDKDYQKKKEALNKEKSLINERLQARRNARSAEDKEEQLAELQRQLALVSADSTRTKDAKSLRKQISDLQKELADTAYENLSNAAIENIDNEIEAYDKQKEYEKEMLDEHLKNANNFDDTVSQAMASADSFTAYLSTFSEEFKNSLPEDQLKMMNEWIDLFNKSQGLDNQLRNGSTYNDLIASILTSESSFMSFMQNSDGNRDYANGTDAARAVMEYSWQQMYQDMVNANIDTASFTADTHTWAQVVSKVDELKDWTFKVERVDGTELENLDLPAAMETLQKIGDSYFFSREYSDYINQVLSGDRHVDLSAYEGYSRDPSGINLGEEGESELQQAIKKLQDNSSKLLDATKAIKNANGSLDELGTSLGTLDETTGTLDTSLGKNTTALGKLKKALEDLNKTYRGDGNEGGGLEDEVTYNKEPTPVPSGGEDQGQASKHETVKSGWQKENGNWYYYENGTPFKATDWDKEWKSIDDQWYVFDKSGKMLTGWQNNKNNLWYYHGGADEGGMQIGWIADGENWYYTNSDGWMVTGDWTIDGKTETFDSHGVWQGGKVQSSGTGSNAGKFGWTVEWSTEANKWVAVQKEGAKQKKADAEATAKKYNQNEKNNNVSAFAEGGLVDYTGPAWVDGTKTRPEAFLDAIDTENIRSLLDAINYIRIDPIIPDTSAYTNNNQTIGDINITIEQASLNTDADINDVARKVGRAFTRELSKEGLNLTRLAF